MRVHHVSNSIADAGGGAQRVVRRLHTSLLAMGVESRLVSLSGDGMSLPQAANFDLPSPYDAAALPRLARCLGASVRPGDIVHGHLFPTSAYLAALRRAGFLRGATLVFTEHNTWNRRRTSWTGKAIDLALYSQFDHVIAISDGVRRTLVDWLPFLSGRTSVVYNGGPPRYAQALVRPEPEIPLIVSLGSLRYNKNYLAAIDAVSRLGDLRFRYKIGGAGPDRAAIEAKIAQLGLSDRVELLGYVSEPHKLLEAADIFLMPSVVEGFGLAALEAMNASLPVVAGDVAGLREVVGSDGRCGVLVDPTSPAAIAAGIRTLLTSPERARMGAVGFARSLEFDEESMLRGYLAVYGALGFRPPLALPAP